VVDTKGKAGHVETIKRLPGIKEGHRYDAALEVLGTDRVVMTDEQVSAGSQHNSFLLFFPLT